MSETGRRKRGRRGSPESWSVDAYVGQRLRARRSLLGISQEKLGEAIGLTFQQVQKYERGSNRISAGTLYRLGQALGVPVGFFFDSYDTAPQQDGDIVPVAPVTESAISRREARLLRSWRNAPEAVANEVLALLSSLSGDKSADATDLRAFSDATPAARLRKLNAGGEKKSRRRHGAVWDPTDILSAGQE
jgi:transcriptional regulator with XRE-family HTH domain